MSQSPNLFYKCYNPIMTICLCCELLDKAGSAFAKNKKDADDCASDLQELGNLLNGETDESSIESLYLATDFCDRTTSKHISDFEYEPLLRDSNVQAQLQREWVGESYQCIGTAADFSLLHHLSEADIRKLPEKALESNVLMDNNFAPN